MPFFQLSYIHRLSSLAFSFYLDMLFDPDTAISTLAARYVHRLTKMYDITVSKHNLEHLFIVVTRCNDTVRKYIIKTIGNLVFDEQTIDCLSVCIGQLDIKYLIDCAEKVVGNNTELVKRAIKKWSDKKAEDEDKKENNIEMNEKDVNDLERMQNGSNKGNVKDQSENDVDEGITGDEQAYNEVVDHHDENSTRVVSEVDHVSDPLPVHTMNDNSSINRSLFKENNLGQSLFAFFLGPSNDYLQVFVQMNKHKSKNIQKRERDVCFEKIDHIFEGRW
ncbi:hypothetical protein THOM_2381 [Trachipleistophora hominis]|uniref:Uncharacterized protein n=1 Tax=Trachipleistophora hominis TaxID=72359 RepID=L7JTH1_TRAHO|nr:hypothetical protein THOM_2381 [Trachipleistophora hominis]